MKKTLIAIAALATVTAFGQGTIGFGNSSSYKITIGGTGVTSAQAVRAELYYAPNTASLGTLTSDSTLYTADNSAYLSLVGLGSAWTTTTPGAASVGSPISGVFTSSTRTTGNEIAGGSTVYLQVRAWSGGYADWDTAVNAIMAGTTGVYAGWTTVPWLNGTGAPAGSPPSNPVAMTLGAAGFNGLALNQMSLVSVPEPGSLALAGLGAAAMLIFRRRK